jgi:hypothetical protein
MKNAEEFIRVQRLEINEFVWDDLIDERVEERWQVFVVVQSEDLLILIEFCLIENTLEKNRKYPKI